MVHSAVAPAKFRRGDKPSPFGQEENRCIPDSRWITTDADDSRPALVNRQVAPRR